MRSCRCPDTLSHFDRAGGAALGTPQPAAGSVSSFSNSLYRACTALLAAARVQQEVRAASVCVVVPAEKTNIAEEPLQLTPPNNLRRYNCSPLFLSHLTTTTITRSNPETVSHYRDHPPNPIPGIIVVDDYRHSLAHLTQTHNPVTLSRLPFAFAALLSISLLSISLIVNLLVNTPPWPWPPQPFATHTRRVMDTAHPPLSLRRSSFPRLLLCWPPLTHTSPVYSASIRPP